MEDLAAIIRMFSVSEMHRPLFHPLATVKHRTWAGTWNKRNRTKQNTSVWPQQMETAFTKWTHKLTPAAGNLAVFWNTPSFKFKILQPICGTLQNHCSWEAFGRVYRSFTAAVHVHTDNTITNKKKTPWSESASELYRPSDRRLSTKWLPTFCG
jgi:hypothetical protein